MNKVKILYFITKSHWGGAATYIIDLASGLDKENFEIFIAAGGNGPLKDKSEELGFSYLEIKHFERRINFIAEIFSFFEILKILRNVKPDIIHVNSSKAGGVCGLAGYIFKIFGNNLISVFTAHGWAFHESRSRWQIFLIRLASRITCLFYTKIICITSFDYNSALRYRISNQKKLVLIPNGIDLESIKFFRKKDAQEKLLGEEKELVVGTVGEWVRNKGWDILLSAVYPIIEKYPQMNLILIAGGESPERKEIFQERIKVIENLPKASRYLKAFDIFVFPSRKEGLSYALLEASLAQIPIIATAVGGNYDIIDSDKTGILIPPGNTEILSKTLEKVIKNLPEYKKMGKRAKEKVENNFSISHMREKTYLLYK